MLPVRQALRRALRPSLDMKPVDSWPDLAGGNAVAVKDRVTFTAEGRGERLLGP